MSVVLLCALGSSSVAAAPGEMDVLSACEALIAQKHVDGPVTSCIERFNRKVAPIPTLVGVHFMSQGDFQNAVFLFRQGAEVGDPLAQNGLGYLYQTGQGVEENRDKANELFLKSAQQGNPDSQFWLGENLILAGDYENGFMWTEKAARSGSADAQFNLAVLYRDGKGTESDTAQMYFWFLMAARNGHDRAKPFMDRVNAELPPDVAKELKGYVEDELKNCPGCIR